MAYTDPVERVRTVARDDLLVLDPGADVSLLPYEMNKDKGVETRRAAAMVTSCGRRMGQIEMWTDAVAERVGLKGWRFDEEGRPFCISSHAKTFQDPSYLFSWRFWPLRSTLIRRGEDNAWLIVEFCS